MHNTQEVWRWLSLIGSMGFLAAIYFSVRLSNETRHERYWLMFALSALCFALHYWLMALEFYHIVPENVAVPGEALSGLIGAVLFGYASYGLHRAMVNIRLKTE